MAGVNHDQERLQYPARRLWSLDSGQFRHQGREMGLPGRRPLPRYLPMATHVNPGEAGKDKVLPSGPSPS